MLLKNIQLRQAGSTDWPAISALLEANKLPLDGAQAHLHNYVLAVQNGQTVGCAGAEVYGDIALLRSVAVSPALHQQGVGKAMLGMLLEEAKRRGIQKMYLLSVTAPEYFAQYGFKRMPHAMAPKALEASAEFQGACPACAALMLVKLAADVPELNPDLPVAVIGAGPVGLAVAAHLLQRGITPLVLEAGNSVGANMQDYAHVRLFSPWRYNLDAAMTALLAPTGWQAPPLDELPLSGDVVDKVLKPFAALPQVAPHLQLGTRVRDISSEGFDKVKTQGRERAAFVIRATQEGRHMEFRARAVIDASGTWGTPNPIGANGLKALGELDMAQAIFYGIPDILGRDRARYTGKRTLVVGAGHSAANALLSLAELAKQAPNTQLVWSTRSPALTRVFGGGAGDALPARGQLGLALRDLKENGSLEFRPGVRIRALRKDAQGITVEGLDADGKVQSIQGIDEIICATGQRPDLSLSSELRLKLDAWLESTEALGPLIDPNLHSCGTVRPHGHHELSHPEPGFYTVGVKSYGRAPTFLMATGFEQARSVVAAIAGDLVAADRVELDLPETGVCSTDYGDSGAPGGNAAASKSACCGPSTAQADVAIEAMSRATEPSAKKAPCCGSGAASAEKAGVKKTACCG